jgi:hypothetical protein
MTLSYNIHIKNIHNIIEQQKIKIVREALRFIKCAIQKAQKGDMEDLNKALEVLELMDEVEHCYIKEELEI